MDDWENYLKVYLDRVDNYEKLRASFEIVSSDFISECNTILQSHAKKLAEAKVKMEQIKKMFG